MVRKLARSLARTPPPLARGLLEISYSATTANQILTYQEFSYPDSGPTGRKTLASIRCDNGYVSGKQGDGTKADVIWLVRAAR